MRVSPVASTGLFGIREQSVQSSALKARLQQKAVARPSARVVNSKFTRLLSVPAPPGVFLPVFIRYSYPHLCPSPWLSLRHRSRSLQEERDSW